MQSLMKTTLDNLISVGYPESSKGYRFDCPSHGTKLIESIQPKFPDEGDNRSSLVVVKV